MMLKTVPLLVLLALCVAPASAQTIEGLKSLQKAKTDAVNQQFGDRLVHSENDFKAAEAAYQNLAREYAAHGSELSVKIAFYAAGVRYFSAKGKRAVVNALRHDALSGAANDIAKGYRSAWDRERVDASQDADKLLAEAESDAARWRPAAATDPAARERLRHAEQAIEQLEALKRDSARMAEDEPAALAELARSLADIQSVGEDLHEQARTEWIEAVGAQLFGADQLAKLRQCSAIREIEEVVKDFRRDLPSDESKSRPIATAGPKERL